MGNMELFPDNKRDYEIVHDLRSAIQFLSIGWMFYIGHAQKSHE